MKKVQDKEYEQLVVWNTRNEGGAMRKVAIALGWDEDKIPYQEFLDELSKGYQLTLEDLEKACELFAKYGWTLPMDSQPGEVLDLVDSCSEENIDNYFYKFYTENNNENLLAIFEEIQENEAIIKWKRLMNECILAYKSELYLVTIPSLISIIEGLISTFMDNPNSIRIMNVCKDMTTKHNGYHRLLWVSIHNFIQNLFEKQNFNGMRPGLINRHWILHGRDETTWRDLDAIKLFVAVHALLVVSR